MQERPPLLKDLFCYFSGSLSQAIWDPHLNSVVVTKQTGSHWSAVGHMVHKKLHLYPEEALYLLEIVSVINY